MDLFTKHASSQIWNGLCFCVLFRCLYSQSPSTHWARYVSCHRNLTQSYTFRPSPLFSRLKVAHLILSSWCRPYITLWWLWQSNLASDHSNDRHNIVKNWAISEMVVLVIDSLSWGLISFHIPEQIQKEKLQKYLQ